MTGRGVTSLKMTIYIGLARKYLCQPEGERGIDALCAA